MRINRELTATEGVVEEVHDTRRDAVLSTFPSFRTTALYEPGMSGGPVINEDGLVIGVISHGLGGDGMERPCGYAASIAGAAELAIDLRGDDGVEREFTASELVKIGAIEAPIGGVSVDRDSDGVRVRWHQ